MRNFYDLAKASMERTRLQNRFLQGKTDLDIISYAKNRSYCVSLPRKSNTSCFQKLNINQYVIRSFYKTAKTLLSDKAFGQGKINLEEDNQT